MKCKNCEVELTQMKNEAGEDSCLRCLKCHPMPTGEPVIKAKKDNVKVDEPWTDERVWKLVEPKVRELFIDLIEDYVIAQNKSTDEQVSADSAETITINDTEVNDKKWREQAKELEVPLYDHELKKLRTKADVLVDIAAKMTAQGG